MEGSDDSDKACEFQGFTGTIGEHEEWKTIPSLLGRYEASSFGRIRSVDRIGATCYGAARSLKGRIVATNTAKNGYMRIAPKITKTQSVHRLVAEAFIENPNSLPCVNHIDGNRSNNRPDNLEWCTQGHNVRHAYVSGAMKKPPKQLGEKCKLAKLKEAQVVEIKKSLAAGEKHSDIAAKYGVRKNTISAINTGVNWNHVK